MAKKKKDPFYQNVGWHIRVARTHKRVPMESLAADINLKRAQLNRYELGYDRISVKKLAEISDILNVPISNFLEGEADEKQMKHRLQYLEIADEIESLPNEEMRKHLYEFLKTVNCNLNRMKELEAA